LISATATSAEEEDRLSEAALPDPDHLGDYNEVFSYTDDNQRVPRIYGGRIARPNEFPYQAAVLKRVRNTEVFVFVCGAAIYSKSYIVTAGHCLEEDGRKRTPDNLRVVVGQSQVRLYLRQESRELLRVNQTFIHNGFKTEGIYFVVNDIGLIRLEAPLNYTSSVRRVRVALPSEGPTNGNVFCIYSIIWNKTYAYQSQCILISYYLVPLRRWYGVRLGSNRSFLARWAPSRGKCTTSSLTGPENSPIEDCSAASLLHSTLYNHSRNHSLRWKCGNSQ
jgi:hypothetical protein